tara:strand:+ start:1414 stop:2319 length:906 start_codon:yes stop_codon:yes gene_type:complete
MKKPTLICVVGPTAIGKTSLGIKLAKELDSEIISADSRQIYKGMPIGTAAPTAEEQSEAKHHFVDFLNPDQLYSAGDFEKDALEFLDGYFENCDVAVLVGGSGLYVKGVVEGFDNLPSDLKLRKELNSRLENKGLEVLQAELAKLDPVHFEKMDSKNPQRVIRAIEVCLCFGKPFSDHHNEVAKKRPFNIVQIGLEAPREIINQRIERRTNLMLESGWVEETGKLLPYRDHNSLNTVGYKEIISHLDGEMSLEEARERIVIRTRQFAKRQMTWFKKDKSVKWFGFEEGEKAMEFAKRKFAE